MRALQKLGAVCVATGFFLSSGWGLSSGTNRWIPKLTAEQTARADTLVEQQGHLVTGDAVLDDGSLYDQYVFSGEGGQYATISLESDEFDPYLILLDPSGQRIGENDDTNRTNRNSRLIVKLPATGTYTAVANSYESGINGSYAIQIDVANDKTALSQTLASTAVPRSSAVCTGAIADMTSTLETDREINAVVSSLQLDRLYANEPSSRPHGVNVTVEGAAALSVMFSPQLLTQLSAQLVGSCTSVGAVVFSMSTGDAEAGDFERTFGFLPMPGDTSAQAMRGEEAAEQVTEFSCVSRGSDDDTLLSWGERLCT